MRPAIPAKRGIPLDVLNVDVAEAVTKYENYGLILVRPDQHVVWRSRTEPTATIGQQVLDRVTGALMMPRAIREIPAHPLDATIVFDPVSEVESPDRTMRYVATPGEQMVVRSRVDPDGTLSTPRPYLRGNFTSLSPDSSGGVWTVDDSDRATVVRYDSAGRRTAVALLDGIATACRFEPADPTQLLVTGQAMDGTPRSWVVNPEPLQQ